MPKSDTPSSESVAPPSGTFASRHSAPLSSPLALMIGIVLPTVRSTCDRDARSAKLKRKLFPWTMLIGPKVCAPPLIDTVKFQVLPSLLGLAVGEQERARQLIPHVDESRVHARCRPAIETVADERGTRAGVPGEGYGGGLRDGGCCEEDGDCGQQAKYCAHPFDRLARATQRPS
jgi:hypothetical protein